jgi:hypothetical protein
MRYGPPSLTPGLSWRTASSTDLKTRPGPIAASSRFAPPPRRLPRRTNGRWLRRSTTTMSSRPHRNDESSKVANERSKMREKADLREANPNDIVTNSDVTPSHRDDFRPRPMSRRNRRLSPPFGAPSPLWVRCGYYRQTRDDSSRCELRGPIPARLLEGEGLTTRNRIICRITEEFFAAALTLRCELHRDHLGRYTVTTENDFSTRPMSQCNRCLSFPFVAQSFRSEVANNSKRVATSFFGLIKGSHCVD